MKKGPARGAWPKPASNEALLVEHREAIHELELRVIELEMQNDALRAARLDASKDDFLALVSHDLRSPLAPMMLWVRALRTGGLSDDLRARAVDALELCLGAEMKLIEELIDIALARRGELRLERRRFDLQAVVKPSVEAVAPYAADKRIRLMVETAPEPLWVMGDPARLGQVVSNLLLNSVDFTPECGRIDLSVGAQDGQAVLVLRDDGEDVEGARLAGAFEPPGPGTSAAGRRGHPRLGLGLTITRHLVAEHGGTITAESAATGRGTRFTVTLPVPTAEIFP